MNLFAAKSLSATVALILASASALADGGPDAGTVHRVHKAAINRGDVPAAMSYLSDDVRYVAGPNCTAAAPCVGTAAAWKGFVEMAVGRRMLIVPDAAQLPKLLDAYRTRVEVSWPGIADTAGVQRIVGIDAYTVREGRIASLTFTPDLADAPTAAYFKATTASVPGDHRAGEHPALAARRIIAAQGCDYAAKFYPHPAWMYLSAEEPHRMADHPAVVAHRRAEQEGRQATQGLAATLARQ